MVVLQVILWILFIAMLVAPKSHYTVTEKWQFTVEFAVVAICLSILYASGNK